MQIFNFGEEGEVPTDPPADQVSSTRQRRKKKAQREVPEFTPNEGLYIKNQVFAKAEDKIEVESSPQPKKEQSQVFVQEQKRLDWEERKEETEGVIFQERNIFAFEDEPELPVLKEESKPSPASSDVSQIRDLGPFLSDPKMFAYNHLPKGMQIKCLVERDKSGLNMLAPVYHLTLEQTGQHILSAKKKINALSSYYHLSLSKEDFDPELGSYLGRLKWQADGEFTLFDQLDKGRNQLLKVKYIPNIGEKGPRKLFVQAIKELGKVSKGEGLVITDSNSVRLINKKPKWNDSIRSFVLNFMGRVKVPSVKNFILTEQGKDENVLLFGKVNDEFFHLDFKFPLSPMQAMAIALSSFDYTST